MQQRCGCPAGMGTNKELGQNSSRFNEKVTLGYNTVGDRLDNDIHYAQTTQFKEKNI